MSDIIERLHGPDGMEAGQEILRLREENARLREALKPFAKLFLYPVNVFPGLKTGDFSRERATFRPDNKNV